MTGISMDTLDQIARSTRAIHIELGKLDEIIRETRRLTAPVRPEVVDHGRRPGPNPLEGL